MSASSSASNRDTNRGGRNQRNAESGTGQVEQKAEHLTQNHHKNNHNSRRRQPQKQRSSGYGQFSRANNGLTNSPPVRNQVPHHTAETKSTETEVQQKMKSSPSSTSTKTITTTQETKPTPVATTPPKALVSSPKPTATPTPKSTPKSKSKSRSKSSRKKNKQTPEKCFNKLINALQQKNTDNFPLIIALWNELFHTTAKYRDYGLLFTSRTSILSQANKRYEHLFDEVQSEEMDDVLGKFAPPAAALFVVGVGVVVEQRQTTKLTACPLIFFLLRCTVHYCFGPDVKPMKGLSPLSSAPATSTTAPKAPSTSPTTPLPAPPTALSPSPSPSPSPPSSPAMDGVVCPACTLINASSNARCTVCDTELPTPTTPPTTTTPDGAASLRTRTPQYGEENGKTFTPAPRQSSNKRIPKKVVENNQRSLSHAMFLLVNSIELVLGTSTDVLVEEEESEQKNGNAETWLIPDKTGYDSLVLMCDPELELDEIAATLEDEVTYGDLILSTPTLQLCITAAIGLGGIMGAATRKLLTIGDGSSAKSDPQSLTAKSSPSSATATTTIASPSASPAASPSTASAASPSAASSASSSSVPLARVVSRQIRTSASWDPLVGKNDFDDEEDPMSIVNGIVMCGQAMSTAQFVCGLPRMGEFAYDMQHMVGK
jgi:hypothetical protein